MKKLTLFIIIIVLGLIFFFPKPSGGGGSCLGCENTECKCFGFQKNWVAIGPWRSTCYGIPYSCKTSYIGKHLDETANWKTYRNEEYGFEFKYPMSWNMKESVPQDFCGEIFCCATLLKIELVDPALPKTLYEAIPGGTQEDRDWYLEKYGTIPSLNIHVRKTDCKERQRSVFTQREQNLINQLVALGVDKELATFSVSLAHSPQEIEGELKDICKESKIIKIGDNNYVIKNTQCCNGTWLRSGVIFISKNNYILNIRDAASQYSIFLNQILSTFRFIK